ncbi:hypothetical protein [Fundidesulfovibrio agrisoli]|uniref:hypothetical protein n=1 Tax=Fundidesulfovibrio agrisoli TaxID=2922717 RepID=UPI001FAB5A85|nr:hypothetical protein [Fundidesulfovibrio agrisoli]
MTMLRLRAVQLALVALILAAPAVCRREIESCFNRLDEEAKRLERAGTIKEEL